MPLKFLARSVASALAETDQPLQLMGRGGPRGEQAALWGLLVRDELITEALGRGGEMMVVSVYVCVCFFGGPCERVRVCTVVSPVCVSVCAWGVCVCVCVCVEPV